jgi:hypothetical protein
MTAHDAPDTSVTDAQITVWLDAELRTVMREIADYAPPLMLAVSGILTISAVATPTFAKPTDFGSVHLVERLGTTYFPIPRVDDLNSTNSAQLSWGENATTIEIFPAGSSVGTYRLKYIKQPAAGYTSLDVPDGCERIIAMRVAAIVALRFSEDPGPFIARADAAKANLFPQLRKRTGMHAAPGIRRERSY